MTDDKKNPETPGERVDKLRDKNGDTTTGLAKEIGYAKSHMSDLINGKKQWNNSSAQRVADRYHVTVDYILHGETNARKKIEAGLSLETQVEELFVEMQNLNQEELNRLSGMILKEVVEILFPSK